MLDKEKEKSQQLADTLVGFLEEQDEEDLIAEVARELELFSRKDDGKDRRIVATSAIKLNNINKRKIQRFFLGVLNEKYPVVNVVDTDVLGGIKLEWGDLLLDLTLSSRLNLLRRQLV